MAASNTISWEWISRRWCAGLFSSNCCELSALVTERPGCGFTLSPSHTLTLCQPNRQIFSCLSKPCSRNSLILYFPPRHHSLLHVSLVHLKPVSFTLALCEHKLEGDVCRISSGSLPLFPQCRGLFTARHYNEAPRAPSWNLHTQPDTLNIHCISSAA